MEGADRSCESAKVFPVRKVPARMSGATAASSRILISIPGHPRRADLGIGAAGPRGLLLRSWGSALRPDDDRSLSDAGFAVASMDDLLASGVYCTTAVKCAKLQYAISAGTVKACSALLEKELVPFRNVRAWLLMGDTAISAVQRDREARRGPPRHSRGIDVQTPERVVLLPGARAFPSYLQAGPGFYIEKSKRSMIADDIGSAMALFP